MVYHSLNYYDIEDALWYCYNGYMKNESEQEKDKFSKDKFSKDMGVDAVPYNDDVYEKFIEWYGGVHFVQAELDDIVWSMDGGQ